MKLELTKNGEIRAFEAIATIENFQNNRNDVLTILEHIEENAFADEVKLNVLMGCRENSSVARGVINYLIGINMIDYKISIHKKLSLERDKAILFFQILVFIFPSHA